MSDPGICDLCHEKLAAGRGLDAEWGIGHTPECPRREQRHRDPDHADCLAALRAPAQFDYAQLERRMWEEVREQVNAIVDDVYRDTRITKGHALIAAIRNYAFAYRLSRIGTPRAPFYGGCGDNCVVRARTLRPGEPEYDVMSPHGNSAVCVQWCDTHGREYV